MTEIAFPYVIDGDGRTRRTDPEPHVREMIEQLLFTAPGERVNRPDFGCGIRELVFGAASSEVASATEMLVAGALQRWLGDVIEVEDVDVTAEDSTLRVRVQYRLIRNRERRAHEFVQEL